jgi:hypothetical protein
MLLTADEGREVFDRRIAAVEARLREHGIGRVIKVSGEAK